MTPQPNPSARRLPSWLRTGIALSALAALAVSSAAGPSPAQQVFDEALNTLSANYFGYATLDAGALRSSFGTRLEDRCAGQGEACPYSAASEIVTEMAASLGDPHTYRVTPEVARARELEFAGRPLETPALGITVGPLPDAPALVVKRVLENSPASRAGWRGATRSGA